MDLLERDTQLAELGRTLDKTSAGRGHLLFVGGEAGVGKTSLVKRFYEAVPQTVRVFIGASDALSTPRPLAPLVDVADAVSHEVAQMLKRGENRPAIFHAFLGMLKERATLVVFEDVHWADEATLDLLRYLARRIAETKALLIATYRDDEVGLRHPLRVVLGDVATSANVARMSLSPLSEGAVRRLAAASNVDTSELYRLTGGNPFFVTEVLSTGFAGVPATVRDAVLARASRLSRSGYAVLEAAAVIGARAEHWLLSDMLGAEVDALDEVHANGMVQVQGDTLTFRHELARQVILEVLPPSRQQALHRFILEALKASPVKDQDPARLAHHAEAAQDQESVLRYALEAAQRASGLQSHREAFAQYARALRFAATLAPRERVQLLEDYAREGAVVDALGEAIAALEVAIDVRKQSGEPLEVAVDLSYLARLLVLTGRNAEGMTASQAALDVLPALPPTVQHARVYQIHAHLWMLDRNTVEANRWGHKALELSQRLGDIPVTVSALNTLGSALLVSGDARGRALLERSLAAAQGAGLHASASTAFGNLASGAGEMYRFAEADHYLSRGIAYCLEHDLDFDRFYMSSWQALSHLYQGRWREATETALAITRRPGVAMISQIMTLIALGRLRARRGDPEVWPVLNEALALATQTRTLQRLAPVRAARAEAAWLAGDADKTRGEARAAFDLALQKQHPWFVGELAYWRWKAGDLSEVPAVAAKPFVLQMAGEWRRAAAAWAELGCPYEVARAQAESDDAAALKEALATFRSLGADPAAQRLGQRLRNLGIKGVPRGPRPVTEANPAHLTRRQLEVLLLLVEGHSNAEIAAKLFCSPKTVDHHVSAVLGKLEVGSRLEAVRAAGSLGILGQRRESEPPK